jgi:hypothetical protein
MQSARRPPVPERSTKKRPLWRCPRCGHRFVTRNVWHSCSRHTLAEHFAGKDPIVRRVFDAFLTLARRFGPVTVIPQKTRISLQARVRFSGAVTYRRWIDCVLWLTRRVEHPRLHRVEFIPPRCHAHRFRLTHPSQLDEAFAALVREACAVGRQDHLDGARRRL